MTSSVAVKMMLTRSSWLTSLRASISLTSRWVFSDTSSLVSASSVIAPRRASRRESGAPDDEVPGVMAESVCDGAGGSALSGANGRGGAPGQERATPPFCIERLLEGALLTHLRSICGSGPRARQSRRTTAPKGPASGGQRPALRRSAAAPSGPLPAQRRQLRLPRPRPHTTTCHATMVRISHPIDKNFVEIR